MQSDSRFRRLPLLQRVFLGLMMFGLIGVEAASGQEGQAADQSDPAAVVEMTDRFKFDPETVTIQVGETVKWVNEPSTILHTVTAVSDKAMNSESVRLPDGAEPFNSGELQPGEVFTHTFMVPGRYKYFCIPHEQADMIGEVVVESAKQGGQETDAEKPAQQGAAQAKKRGTEAEEEKEKASDPTFVFGAHAPPRPPEHREATGFWKFVYWLGNFHPAATDLPVGIILAGFLSEILLLATGRPAFALITRYCVWVGGIAAFGTAIFGWCLAGFQFYDGAWMLTTHRLLGTTTGVWGLVLITTAEVARSKGSAGWKWGFRGVLLVAAILVVVTGYFGGAMIYGLDHYAWPDAGNG